MKTRNWGGSLPDKVVQYLTVDEVLTIHHALVERFGGLGGVRDLGLLESALYRPRTGYYRDLAEMAAALFESLLMNHPFIEGNKRVAFFASDIFLRLNGWKLKVDARAAHAFLTGLLEHGESDFDHLLPWIRKCLVPLKSTGGSP
jgi:death-on-curing protein